jgi:outer membrane protein OmpA-like peptidoglycan-associated protein
MCAASMTRQRVGLELSTPFALEQQRPTAQLHQVPMSSKTLSSNQTCTAAAHAVFQLAVLAVIAAPTLAGAQEVSFSVLGNTRVEVVAPTITYTPAVSAAMPYVAPHTQVVGTRIHTLDRVFFATDSEAVLAGSQQVLAEVAAVMRRHPELRRVRIEAHTDAQAPDAYNQQLSQRRADFVRAYLIACGVDASRLEAVGFGASRPTAPNHTELGRQENRRVEFLVVP